jgi:hypothetical protein
MPGDPRAGGARAMREQAYDLILGDAGKVFDLSQEKDELRERYGRNTFGQSCLMARRLVERGVPYITINYKGWDTHKQHFQIMNRKLPELDKGWPRCSRTSPSAACSTAPSSGGAASSAARPRCSGRRPGTAAASLRQGLLRRGRRRRVQGRPGGRRLRRPRRGGQGPAGVSGGPDRQHVRTAGHR